MNVIDSNIESGKRAENRYTLFLIPLQAVVTRAPRSSNFSDLIISTQLQKNRPATRACSTMGGSSPWPAARIGSAPVAMMVRAIMPMSPEVVMPIVMMRTMPTTMLPMMAMITAMAHFGRQLAGFALRGGGDTRTDRRRRLRLLHRSREHQKRTESGKS
jgi:hypothetical protein